MSVFCDCEALKKSVDTGLTVVWVVWGKASKGNAPDLCELCIFSTILFSRGFVSVLLSRN